jgi:hypothetical protein
VFRISLGFKWASQAATVMIPEIPKLGGLQAAFFRHGAKSYLTAEFYV